MAATLDQARPIAPHPLHLVLLAGMIPWFLGAALADWAYAVTYHVQWKNFASWLIVGGLVFGGVVLVLALVDLLRARRRAGRDVIYVLLLLATWVLAFFNALVHAKDAWAAMPAGLVLSVVTLLAACVATWWGVSGFRTGVSR